MDLGIGGHSRFEFVLGILQANLDAIDELHPLFCRLYIFGGKFSFGGDESDLARIYLTRIP